MNKLDRFMLYSVVPFGVGILIIIFCCIFLLPISYWWLNILILCGLYLIYKVIKQTKVYSINKQN